MTIFNSTVLGYPRIGPRRELKRALESFWDGRGSLAELHDTGRALRRQTWLRLAELGLTDVPGNTFSLYDQMLDTAVMLGAVPDRYRGDDAGNAKGNAKFAAYFAMARGTREVAPLPMTKWFDTNYHYIVPEINESTRWRLDAAGPVADFREALALGVLTRPVVIGPITFLLLSSRRSLDRLDAVAPVYAGLLDALHAEGVQWVQFDEPALVCDRTPAELDAVRRVYTDLAGVAARPRLMVASYFGDLGESVAALADTPVDGVAVDLVRGSGQGLEPLAGKTLFAGVVSGRDVWRTDLGRARRLLDSLPGELPGEVVVSTSCSLLHVPYDLAAETDLDPRLRRELAFADQKVAEVVALAGGASTSEAPAAASQEHPKRVAAQRSPYEVRARAQAERLRLPVLPVTTIGSFPQTDELRAARAAAVAGHLDDAEYERRIEAEIERVIRLQEQLGLDVLVHGEPERNDMVQYFAERLDGFAVTRNGWVQSYGSRCTRPPIIVGDITRPAPITVRWARHAQSLTGKPVKGMLTGPVTIVAWSFKRKDFPMAESVWQVASALRDEVGDLAAAGIGVIQVDEPALRELMPLRHRDQDAYLDWAVQAYRHATSGAGDATQIHTHLCYSEASLVLSAIDRLDADVTTIESARSHAPIPDFTRGLGPGVYDIHSPRVPAEDEVAELIAAALKVIPASRLWVNPDCGLKTRTYEQVEAALRNLVGAARRHRVTPAG